VILKSRGYTYSGLRVGKKVFIGKLRSILKGKEVKVSRCSTGDCDLQCVKGWAKAKIYVTTRGNGITYAFNVSAHLHIDLGMVIVIILSIIACLLFPLLILIPLINYLYTISKDMSSLESILTEAGRRAKEELEEEMWRSNLSLG